MTNNYDSTAIRPRYDHSTFCVTTRLLHRGIIRSVAR